MVWMEAALGMAYAIEYLIASEPSVMSIVISVLWFVNAALGYLLLKRERNA